MALYEYNGKNYFYGCGKWMDEVSRPVDPEIADALSKLYPESVIKKREAEQRSKRNQSQKKYGFGRPFSLANAKSTPGKKYVYNNSNRHRKATELDYNRSIELTADQKRALEILESGENVFLTGEAGTGKSFVLKEFLHRNKNKNIIICAFTGIAAINVGGSTIHKVFRAPLDTIKPNDYNPHPSEALINADTIIIDEISMCRIDLFEYVVRTLRAAENAHQYHENIKAAEIGKQQSVLPPKQIIVVGDFYQLAPVIDNSSEDLFYTYWDRDTIGDGFAFSSPLWEELNFKNIVLREIVRQSGDPEYIKNLNKIRIGDRSGIEWFNSNISSVPIPGAIYLCGKNRKAKIINQQESEKLPGEPKIYTAAVNGKVVAGDKLTDDDLALKVGMQVMTLINDTNNNFQNGSIGKIVSLGENSVDIRLDNGRQIKVVPYEWEICGYEVHDKKVDRVVLGTFKQLPIRIAYAITIHKSQGQTYPCVNISPDCFAAGQLYVALSRARSAQGMSFEYPIDSGSLLTSFNVKRFYDNLIED